MLLLDGCAATGLLSVVTDFNGLVFLISESIKNPATGTFFVFVADDVVLAGY